MIGSGKDVCPTCCRLRQAWFVVRGHRLLQKLLPVHGSQLLAEQHLKACNSVSHKLLWWAEAARCTNALCCLFCVASCGACQSSCDCMRGVLCALQAVSVVVGFTLHWHQHQVRALQ